MKFFTNKSIWSKIIIVLIFILVFEFIVAKPTLGADVTDVIVEGGGKLLTPVMSLVATIGDAIIGIAQDAIMGTNTSIYPVDVEASIWEILGKILVVAVAVVAAIATVVAAVASGVGVVALIGTIGSALAKAAATIVIGTVVVDIATSSSSAPISQVSASVFSEDVKVPATLYLPVFNYSPEEIFQGKILLFNVDFFGDPIQLSEDSDGNWYYTNDEGEKVITSKQNIAEDLSGAISRWYVGIRNIALVAMMIVLLYIGIRMLLSTLASDKAKYRQMLQDWFIGLMLLFLMHYIMAFSVTLVQKLTDIVSTGVDQNAYAVRFPVDENGKMVKWFNDNDLSYMLYDKDGNQLTTDGTVDVNEGDVAFVSYPTNLLGKLRLEFQFDTGGFSYVGYVICYLVLVFFTVYFTFVYLRRVLYMAFLTMIAPMVAMTYPIDKINDGSAQGFTKWFREYIFNLLIQPMHLLLYYILITSAFELAGENIIYSIVAIGFMIPAEKLLRSLFGFEKASTPSALNGAAGGALAMAGINKIANLISGRGNEKNSKKLSSGNGGNEGTRGNTSVRQMSDVFEDDEDTIDETAVMAGAQIGAGVTMASGNEEKSDESTGENTNTNMPTANESTQQGMTVENDDGSNYSNGSKDSNDSSGSTNSINSTNPNNMALDNNKNIPKRKKFIKGVAKVGKTIGGNAVKYSMRAAPAIRMASRFTRPVFKAATGALAAGVGVAAGVATGDPSNAFQYGAAGAGAGYMAGKVLANNGYNAADNLVANRENYMMQLAERSNDENFRNMMKDEALRERRKEYKKVLRKNNFAKEEIKRMEKDGTINKYIMNEVNAQDAATAELMRKEDSSITQDQAIADAKYAQRVGEKYKGPDRKKWEEHFAGEFQEKAGIKDEKKAKAASKEAMKRVDRFNKYKKKTL